MSLLSFYLKPKLPFRLDLTVWALRRLPHNAMDLWDGSTYTRLFVFNKNAVKIDITQPDEKRIRIDVETDKKASQGELRAQTSSLIEKVLGIRKDLRAFYTLSARDKKLAPLAHEFIGLKPPRFPTLFETLVNAVACQQLSLYVGITLLNRLAKTYGKGWKTDGEAIHAFPAPEDLARATLKKLRGLGFSTNKARSIVILARAVVERAVDLELIETMSDAQALDYLLRFKGVGRWSAEYVLLRGLGRIHIFPGDDVGAQKNLQLLLRLREKPDYKKIRQITSRWHPYAGFVYFNFLLQKLTARGFVSPRANR
jgi:DNA-3-methyladenine glycosylase II